MTQPCDKSEDEGLREEIRAVRRELQNTTNALEGILEVVQEISRPLALILGRMMNDPEIRKDLSDASLILRKGSARTFGDDEELVL